MIFVKHRGIYVYVHHFRLMYMLRSKICHTLRVARQTRPDIMCETSILASTIKHATIQSLHDANKLTRKLNSKEVAQKFQNLGTDSSFVVFNDVSLENL